MNTYIDIHVSYICSCLSLTFFCLGTGIAATIDSNRTGVPSIFHVNCEILIAQGSQRCCCCKRHRKSLCVMATRNTRREEHINDVRLLEEDNELIVSLPTSAYTDSPADSIETLQNRLRSVGTLPTGNFVVQTCLVSSHN